MVKRALGTLKAISTIGVFLFCLSPRAPLASVKSTPGMTVQVNAGSPYDLVTGRVTGLEPDTIRVVVFVRTNRWYIQPFGDERAYLTVGADGTFQTWVRPWSQISAFAIRKGYDAIACQSAEKPLPLKMDGTQVLAVAAYPTLQFSGYLWAVKAGNSLGPGPNSFRAGPGHAWVDEKGRLHLKVTHRDNEWHCAEIYMLHPLNYGTYLFILESRVDLLDPNLIGSVFLYRDVEEEIDVEFSRWGDLEKSPNGQYVVQPWYTEGNRERFFLHLDGVSSTHSIDWSLAGVFFQSAQGDSHYPLPGQILHKWRYAGEDLPHEADQLLVHVNLWLLNGEPPFDGEEAELVVRSFFFKPAGDLDGDGEVNWKDAIMALQVLSGMNVKGIRPDYGSSSADVSGDKRIGMEEVIYILQRACGSGGSE